MGDEAKQKGKKKSERLDKKRGRGNQDGNEKKRKGMNRK